MTDQERAETYLRKHPDVSLCAACIGHELRIPPVAARSILWVLPRRPGYEMQGAKCARCLRGKRTIRYVGGGHPLGAAPPVVDFLLDNAGITLCAACLALAAGASLVDVRRIVPLLAPLPEFDVSEGPCVVCRREGLITVAFTTSGGDAVSDAILTPTRAHGGGVRIDVLSYRTAGGWRPYVSIKVARNSDAWRPSEPPSLLRTLHPTKPDADAAALRAAEMWLDRQEIPPDGGGTMRRGFPEPRRPEQRHRDLRGVLILVIDDHRDTRDMFDEGLSAVGAEVLTAVSGRDALRLAQERLPTVVVVDIAMPEHDGFWFVAELRNLKGGDAVPAIAISGAPLDLLPQSAKDVGFVRALLKPVDPLVLADIVADVVDEATLARAINSGSTRA
jgi:CheY-like chemotaxis protein